MYIKLDRGVSVLRVINIIGAFLVLVCNIVVSFNHSLELFRYGGFTNGLEYVGVVAAEITFIMGGLNIVSSRLAGYSPGIPAYLGGLLGVALIGWSNISAGWEYGLTGILLGAFTPLSLILSEAILSRAIIQGRKKPQEDITHVITADEVSNNFPSVGNEADEMSKGTTVQQVKPVDSEGNESPSSTPSTAQITVAEDMPSESLEGSLIDRDTREMSETLTTSNQTKVIDDQLMEEEMVATAKPSDKVDDIAKVIEIAKEIAKKVEAQEGKRPGRVRLAKLAKCTPHYARVALEELKKPQIS